MTPALMYLFIFIAGASIGSFLNVCIYRWPLELSVVAPRSRCPQCETPIRPRHNVPVLGWLVLRGRCADCGLPIPVRYPLVELLTAVLFVLVTWRAVQLDQLAAVPALLTFTALGVALSAIDLDLRRLPNALVLPAYPVLAALLAVAAAVTGDWSALLRAALGAVALFGFFYALAMLYPSGMGFGDVKLAGVLGLYLGYLGWAEVALGLFLGFFLGGVFGALGLLLRRASRKTQVPYGPFMVLGAFLAIWAGGPLGDAYLRLSGL